MDINNLKTMAQAMRKQLLASTKEQLRQVRNPNHPAQREQPKTIQELEKQISIHGENEVVDFVAYTWFNRFCALRYMDVKGYNPMRIVSPAPEETRIEILTQAVNGRFDPTLTSVKIQDTIAKIQLGDISSQNPDQDIYAQLLVGTCNAYNTPMPYLFQKLSDYTELLMPKDLISDRSILAQIREVMDEDSIQALGVEIVGWLYQFYISEKKDAVIGKVVATEDIPAATQLFTPDWIVRYLVQNTLGRAWLEQNPNSPLRHKWEYYIPEDPNNPSSGFPADEPLRLLDPCCGSGHMLVYAFDLFAAMYLEQGYSRAEIPAMILENNLVGLEIDDRAGQLASFALAMKAMEYDRQFLRRKNVPLPNVKVIDAIHLDPENDKETKSLFQQLAGTDIPLEGVTHDLTLFENGSAFGSLLQPVLTVEQLKTLQQRVKDLENDLFSSESLDSVNNALTQAIYLADTYPLVVTNPPYMGNKGMNADVKAFVQERYPNSKSDLFAVFIERCLELAQESGMAGMVTMQSWMFLSSYEQLRKKIIDTKTIQTMAHAGPRGFDMISGEVVQTTAFTIINQFIPDYNGAYLRLVDGNSEAEKMEMFREAIAP